MEITVYRKSGCPWAAAVMAFLNTLDLSYEIKNVSTDDEYAREVEEKSGQTKSPTVEIDGFIIPDASVEEVADYLEEKGVQV